MSKYFFVLYFSVLGISSAYSQNYKQDFETFRQQALKGYRNFRDSINAEFAEFMRQAWPEYESKPAVPVPDSPEPPAPIIKEPDTPPSNDPVPFDKVTPAPKPVEPPQPVVPIPEPTPQPIVPDKPTFAFNFYGEKCQMPLEDKHRFTLGGVTENNVADGWKVLSSDKYLPVIAKCLDYRSKLRLCDWGYVRFVEKMTAAFFPSSQQNEARLMQMFILTQSGYKVRIAQANNKLVLLLPSKETIYRYSYLSIGGSRYYVTDSSLKEASLRVFDREFPKEQFFSLRISEPPALPISRSVSRQLQSKHDREVGAKVSINKNLIDFYNDYPISSHWDIYANASLSELVKEQLYPVLRSSIAGKGEADAANILLHFVQTALEYATDEEQFGEERPLFGDETLFYPYSDCEDRAILFSILVRELLGLDVVFLYYPGHLATAVCFDTPVTGDYLQVDGKRYVVCDPTYINADIGQSMTQFKQTPATVFKISR
ncbi:MAG: hypothetical protein J1E37_06375 [Prevotella sp.]|nr:hypothetical protein [Prevotella sp.]